MRSGAAFGLTFLVEKNLSRFDAERGIHAWMDPWLFGW
jgi:hypothetical protein